LMRRVWILLLALAIGGGVFSQDTALLVQSLDRLEKALVEKDEKMLAGLLQRELRFGHSNGWVQTREDAMADMRSGALVYESFRREAIRVSVDGKLGFIQEWVSVKGVRNGTSFDIRLFVLQHWTKTRKGWLLLMRQSAKLG
jgi:Domain of unknown function (DUF4440)